MLRMELPLDDLLWMGRVLRQAWSFRTSLNEGKVSSTEVIPILKCHLRACLEIRPLLRKGKRTLTFFFRSFIFLLPTKEFRPLQGPSSSVSLVLLLLRVLFLGFLIRFWDCRSRVMLATLSESRVVNEERTT